MQVLSCHISSVDSIFLNALSSKYFIFPNYQCINNFVHVIKIFETKKIHMEVNGRKDYKARVDSSPEKKRSYITCMQ